MRFINILFVCSLLFCFACGDTAPKEQKASEAKPEAMTESATKYKLTAFTPSQAYPDAKMESMDYKDGKFSFGVAKGSYELGVQTPDAPQKNCANSGKGQHIHLIVDNKPYAAKYVSDFDHEMADGKHYLLAFLSRSYHESIKSADAHMAMKINVEKQAITSKEPVEGPMLFYSRPKGTYEGKANTDKIMLDFYLSNITLGTDYKVLAEINGESHTIDKWQPYYIEGLPMGKNIVKLTLLDKDGKMAKIPLNPVQREFTLKEDVLEKK